MKKRNKKAQFYLIASIILVTLFLSFVSLMNYSSRRDNLEIYKYAEELDIEGEWVLDYDSKMGTNEFDEFAKNYSYYVSRDREIYFLTGEIGNLDPFRYDGESRIDHSSDVNVDGDEATFDIEGNDFTFELKPGQNFYFVMKDNHGLQEYFVTNIE